MKEPESITAELVVGLTVGNRGAGFELAAGPVDLGMGRSVLVFDEEVPALVAWLVARYPKALDEVPAGSL